MNKTEITVLIEKALNELYKRDSDLLSKIYDINERTISHRLAMYFENLLAHTDYQVDVEYNRMRDDYNPDAIGNLMGKRLNWEESGEGSGYVYPDIIVHKRDSPDNLLEIEMKMAWKNRKKDFDYLKINEYMQQLGYQFGVYIELTENREDCKVEFGPFTI